VETKIRLSTCTLRAYKNKKGLFNLNFAPIVRLENVVPLSYYDIRNIEWTLIAPEVGEIAMEYMYGCDSPFSHVPGAFYLEFINVKAKDIPVQLDTFECQLRLKLDMSPHHVACETISETFWGVVLV